MNIIRLHNMILHTKVLGPDTRCAIWFQGCDRNCSGCMSPSSRDKNGGTLVSVDSVCDSVFKLNDIEGITISGGEPFLQIEALHKLLTLVKSKSNLGVIIYTGFTIEQLEDMDNDLVNDIIHKFADMIVDGEYIDSLNDGKALKGSSNQRVVYVTDRYLPHKDMYEQKKRDVEIYITKNDAFFIGVPDKETFEQWTSTASKLRS